MLHTWEYDRNVMNVRSFDNRRLVLVDIGSIIISAIVCPLFLWVVVYVNHTFSSSVLVRIIYTFSSFTALKYKLLNLSNLHVMTLLLLIDILSHGLSSHRIYQYVHPLYSNPKYLSLLFYHPNQARKSSSSTLSFLIVTSLPCCLRSLCQADLASFSSLCLDTSLPLRLII